MPDGQLKSHSLRVYVTRDILLSQNPRLRLLRSHAVTKRAINETTLEEPGVVAPGQEWVETVNGQQVRRSGTLLMFDISRMDFGWRAMLRVMPVVSWTEGDTDRIAVGSKEVTVGSVVLAYGLIRLEIPDIPTSVLVLMGASLTTGGVAYFQDAQKQQAAGGAAPTRSSWAVGDLVHIFTGEQAGELSLSKAQMLFWTALLLVLFVSKSVLDGAIWEVPWALVALMGFSQAGYLAPKLVPQS